MKTVKLEPQTQSLLLNKLLRCCTKFNAFWTFLCFEWSYRGVCPSTFPVWVWWLLSQHFHNYSKKSSICFLLRVGKTQEETRPRYSLTKLSGHKKYPKIYVQLALPFQLCLFCWSLLAVMNSHRTLQLLGGNFAKAAHPRGQCLSPWNQPQSEQLPGLLVGCQLWTEGPCHLPGESPAELPGPCSLGDSMWSLPKVNLGWELLGFGSLLHRLHCNAGPEKAVRKEGPTTVSASQTKTSNPREDSSRSSQGVRMPHSIWRSWDIYSIPGVGTLPGHSGSKDAHNSWRVNLASHTRWISSIFPALSNQNSFYLGH